MEEDNSKCFETDTRFLDTIEIFMKGLSCVRQSIGDLYRQTTWAGSDMHYDLRRLMHLELIRWELEDLSKSMNTYMEMETKDDLEYRNNIVEMKKSSGEEGY